MHCAHVSVTSERHLFAVVLRGRSEVRWLSGCTEPRMLRATRKIWSQGIWRGHEVLRGAPLRPVLVWGVSNYSNNPGEVILNPPWPTAPKDIKTWEELSRKWSGRGGCHRTVWDYPGKDPCQSAVHTLRCLFLCRACVSDRNNADYLIMSMSLSVSLGSTLENFDLKVPYHEKKNHLFSHNYCKNNMSASCLWTSQKCPSFAFACFNIQ